MTPLIRSRALLNPGLTKNPLRTPATFLRIPPASRAFHVSPQPLFLETVLSSTHDLLVGVHSTTGLSWALTLPLAALSLRLFVALPLAIYQRRAHQRRVALQPLRSAWQATIRKATMEKSRHLGPAFVVREAQRRMTWKTFELRRRWKCGVWREWLQILYLPVWLAVIEAIRGMCGATRGLLGLLADGAGDVVPTIKISADLTKETVVPSAPGAFLEVGQATANAQSESAVSATLEPSMVTEGMLWFPDLTVADPLHILPFVLSATLLLNVYTMGRVGLPSGKEPLWRKRLKRILLTVAFAAGPLTLKVPCAMLLYWISSGIVGYVHNLLLDIWMPLQNSFRPVVKSPKQTRH